MVLIIHNGKIVTENEILEGYAVVVSGEIIQEITPEPVAGEQDLIHAQRYDQRAGQGEDGDESISRNRNGDKSQQ